MFILNLLLAIFVLLTIRKMLELIFIKYNLNLFNFKLILTILKTNIILHFSFLRNYYSRNELIWVDGFLLDFLQKKSVDI